MGIDEHFMERAIELAQYAQSCGEVPIGAVLVKDGVILAEGWNQPIQTCDPSAHAEIVCLRNAGKVLNNYRLVDTTLYVTLEPCAMCAKALVHARISRLVYGACDPKMGACGSVINIPAHPAMNHSLRITANILSEPCGLLLKAFFKARR